MNFPRIQRALISVSDKSGLIEFARRLVSARIEILSSGGTARFLTEQGIDVREISAYTGFPEMMDGRLKTLHPKLYGGILGRHDRTDDLKSMEEHDIHPIELVVVNLYPFETTIARDGVSWDEAIEQIDVGGPCLIRAAAKNHRFVTVVTDQSQYDNVARAIERDGSTTLEFRKQLAAAAFARTARYDRAISDYFAKQQASPPEQLFPDRLSIQLWKKAELRYGENPHQQAALYSDPSSSPGIVSARQLHGKELSYNNILDLDAAWTIARSLPHCGAAVIKHNNPCGAASAETLCDAAARAMGGDPLSAFGSIIGFNRTVDAATAEVFCQPGLFVEAIVAPTFDQAAVEILTTQPKWKDNVRLLEVGSSPFQAVTLQLRQVEGGFLAQESDSLPDEFAEWRVVTKTKPTDEQSVELRFAWTMVRHVKSNAIVITKDRTLWGAGAGQMSRVDSVEIALHKAGQKSLGAVLASDAFFPFSDSIEKAQVAGIGAIIQPGGSRRDEEVIAKCDEYGLPMVFTGRRHFKH